MIEFGCNRYHKGDMTPIVTDLAIQDYAEAVLEDYKPKLLKTPGKINALHFLESYLDATVDYKDIYYKEGESPIAGATVFNDDQVLIFDRERRRVKSLRVAAGTILLDNSTMEDGKEAYALFTELHEGGHFLIHPCVYRKMNHQLSLFDFDADQLNESGHVVTCRRNMIETQCNKPQKSRLTTQRDFQEHHANTFAATMAMPRQTFIPCAKDIIRRAGFPNGIWVDEKSMGWDSFIGMSSILEELTSIYGVSKSAAKVQLKRQELLLSEDEYLQRHRQIAVAF